jgi:hypothetical protein
MGYAADAAGERQQKGTTSQSFVYHKYRLEDRLCPALLLYYSTYVMTKG